MSEVLPARRRRRTCDDDRRLYMQVYNLPRQLERARGRLRMLEAQAARLGLHDLLGDSAQ